MDSRQTRWNVKLIRAQGAPAHVVMLLTVLWFPALSSPPLSTLCIIDKWIKLYNKGKPLELTMIPLMTSLMVVQDSDRRVTQAPSFRPAR